MPRRRSRTYCCCKPGSAPGCGTCDRDSYLCCTQQVPFSGWLVSGSLDAGGEENFNVIDCAIAPTADERMRYITTIQPGGGEVYYLVMEDTPGFVRGLVPWSNNPPASNALQFGSGAEYDICAGTCFEYTDQFGAEPVDGVPIGGLIGESTMVYGGGGGIGIYVPGPRQCCSGIPCERLDLEPIICVDDECYCDDPLGLGCPDAPYGLYPTFANAVRVGTFTATGAALRCQLGIESAFAYDPCDIRIEAPVEYRTPIFPGFVFRYEMGATGKFAYDIGPECDTVDSDLFGYCLQDAMFVGDSSPMANAPMFATFGGPCGECFPDEAPSGQYTYDCRCDNGLAINNPSAFYGDCPDPRLSVCRSESPFGIYDCNECNEKISGGHFMAVIT